MRIREVFQPYITEIMDNPQQCGLYSLKLRDTLAGANNGVSDRLISKQGRWSSMKLKNAYIKDSADTKLSTFSIFLAATYLLKYNNINTRTMCELCSKLTICFLLLTLNTFHTLFKRFYC